MFHNYKILLVFTALFCFSANAAEQDEQALKAALIKRLGPSVKFKKTTQIRKIGSKGVKAFDTDEINADVNLIAGPIQQAKDAVHFALHWQSYFQDPDAIIPPGASECDHQVHLEEVPGTGASRVVNPGFDLKAGESCVFQTSAVIVQVAVKSLQDNVAEVEMTALHGFYDAKAAK